MTNPVNCRCGGEAAVEANIEDDYVAVSCRKCGLRLVRDSVDYAKAEWNRVMAEPQRVSQQDIAGVIMHWDSIIADKELADDMAMAIYELVYGEGEK